MGKIVVPVHVTGEGPQLSTTVCCSPQLNKLADSKKIL
jgi:hypothetical protein